MTILNLDNNGKVKYESKKENDVLLDVFLKKSVEDLDTLGIDYDFDEIKKDKDWRNYIECKVKVLMRIESWSCFNEKIKDGEETTIKSFYKEIFLKPFLKKTGFIKVSMKVGNKKEIEQYLNLKDYFNPNKKENKEFDLKPIKKESSLEKLNFKYLYNWFYLSFWNNPNEPIKQVENLYILKYRFPFTKKIELEKSKIPVSDVVQINFTRQDISTPVKKQELFESVSNYLLTKIDLTQDIQEIKLN